MRCIVLMFDSLNRHMLSTHGCDWTHTPNFQRLARRAVTFDQSYVCSMPCMPARRDYLAGRANFLHRSWGPLEPFDDCFPRMLSQKGVHTHMATDHYHYFETGGATDHTSGDTWAFFRGHEGEGWAAQANLSDHPLPEALWPPERRIDRTRQDFLNRLAMGDESGMPQSRTVANGIDFMRKHARQDNWFLHIETFDPHEPFHSPRKYKDLFADHYDRYQGPHADWPSYRPVDPAVDTPEIIEHVRHEYASLLAMCDSKLGDVLDTMDELDLWKDTMLIVWTDHGFLLSEQDCWAKVWAPFYEEVSHTPFFMWDPRQPQSAGQRRQALVQPAIDLAPTILGYFGQSPTPDMTGRDLGPVITQDQPVRDVAIFGVFGGQLNITDGRYVYYLSPPDWEQHAPDEYTLMPARMRTMFDLDRLHDMELAPPFTFTKGCQVLRFPGWPSSRSDPNVTRATSRARHPTRLFDLHADPQQQNPITDAAVTQRLAAGAARVMHTLDAPAKQFMRYGLSRLASA